MSVQCPSCKNQMRLPEPLTTNVRSYGDNIYHVECNHCQSLIRVRGWAEVHVMAVGIELDPNAVPSW